MSATSGGRLRVAIDATPLHDTRTGVGRFTEELIEGASRAPSVELVAYAVSWRGRRDLDRLVPPGVRTVRRPMAARPLRALWRRFDVPRVDRWTGPVDVVHGTNFVVPPAGAARVVSVHDLTFLHHPEMVTADVRQYPGLIERAIAGGAWVHTDSDFVREEVIDRLGAPPSRVVTVPLGITAAPSGDAARGRARAGADRYVLAIGTIEPRKDFPALVRAFDVVAGELEDLRLVLVGPDGWGVEAFDAAVEVAHHRDRIVRTGFVDEATRGDLLAGASVLALTSVYEGFGFTPGEAMLAGVPVVSTAAGAVPEIVGDAALLVPPRDHGALVGALRRVLTDGGFADELRERGPAQARRFSWEATVEGIVTLWQRAAGTGPSDR